MIAVAEFRAALRRFLRSSERIARQSGLTPQRHLLLLMIKGARDGSERSTVTELADRLQLAQSTVTELVRRAEEAGLVAREQSQRRRARRVPPPHARGRAAADALVHRARDRARAAARRVRAPRRDWLATELFPTAGDHAVGPPEPELDRRRSDLDDLAVVHNVERVDRRRDPARTRSRWCPSHCSRRKSCRSLSRR